MEESSLQKWSLASEEVGYYMGKGNAQTDGLSFKVYVPKLLPLIDKAPAQDKVMPINTNGLLNASECKIDCSSSVTTQNYITVSQVDNTSFKRPVLKQDAKLKIRFTDGDVDSGCIIGSIDSSDFDRKVKME